MNSVIRFVVFFAGSLIVGLFAIMGFPASSAAAAVMMFGYGVDQVCTAIEQRSQ